MLIYSVLIFHFDGDHLYWFYKNSTRFRRAGRVRCKYDHHLFFILLNVTQVDLVIILLLHTIMISQFLSVPHSSLFTLPGVECRTSLSYSYYCTYTRCPCPSHLLREEGKFKCGRIEIFINIQKITIIEYNTQIYTTDYN